MKGVAWFKKGDYYYTLEEVQRLMRDVLRAQPENAQAILDGFIRVDKPRGKAKRFRKSSRS
jgi:hypothetical protein